MDLATEQLHRLIERRAGKEPDPDELEPSYAESVRRFHGRRRRQNRALWFAYFCRQAEAHRKLSESYEARAEELCEGGA
jgi:hypothetical protein